MFEEARVLLGSFPKTLLLETERYKIMTVKKVSVCYFSILDRSTGKKIIYKKTATFERALRKNGIDKELLLDNMQKIVLELISSLDKEDLSKEDVDFFAIKKALFRPNEEIMITRNSMRSLILKNTEERNYFEMLYYAKRNNRKFMTTRIEVGCTEMFKMIKREELSMEEVIRVLQSLLMEKYVQMSQLNEERVG